MSTESNIPRPNWLTGVLAASRRWYQSGGSEGQPAGLAFEDLSGQDLSEAVLLDANLQEAQLRGVRLNGALLDGAIANGALFDDAELVNARFFSAQLREARFVGSSARRAVFSRAQLRDADLSSADLMGATFRRASCVSAVFRNAVLSLADFDGADLSGADLRGAQLQGMNVEGARLDSETLLPAIAHLQQLRGEGIHYGDSWVQIRNLADIASSPPGGLPGRSARDLEREVVDALERARIAYTPGSKAADGGVDFAAQVGNSLWLIECKSLSSRLTERSLANLRSEMAKLGSTHGVLVTNDPGTPERLGDVVRCSPVDLLGVLLGHPSEIPVAVQTHPDTNEELLSLASDLAHWQTLALALDDDPAFAARLSAFLAGGGDVMLTSTDRSRLNGIAVDAISEADFAVLRRWATLFSDELETVRTGITRKLGTKRERDALLEQARHLKSLLPG